MERVTQVICGATGIGKTTIVKENKYSVVEVETGKYRWNDSQATCLDEVPENSDWPGNYCEAVTGLIGTVDMILVSSHREVVEEFLRREIPVTLVYPDRSQKEAYRQRYEGRGNPKWLVKLLTENYDNWIAAAISQQGCRHIVLQSGQYLADVVPQIR